MKGYETSSNSNRKKTPSNIGALLMAAGVFCAIKYGVRLWTVCLFCVGLIFTGIGNPWMFRKDKS